MARYVNCILNENKLCNDCGECDICDLDRTKKCDNCGKCMENGNSDYREVLIDNIYETSDAAELDNDDIETDSAKNSDDDENKNYELIDDIDGLNELIEDPEHKYVEEVFPGLLKLRKKEDR
ncbi:hypothetical protein [Clostridium oryzae]|uniref:Uncharacterized protein n=1 Tax=Clostridium oryzae TaxID=1450648 RepID=A0A1V4I9I9_9CLOT|nr:hypothetical protein [Clostridium oryzae]OPJ56583.1 hypothetical protein CLORY_42620 [Clostridium oryzae]